MSLGSALKSVGKWFTTPVEWAMSPAGWLLDQSLNFLGQYNANQANIDLWKKQADWNSPVNQMKRLAEAGLNPNLVYGNGGVSNTITSAPKMDPYKFGSLPDGLLVRQQILNGEKQRELLQAQIDNEKNKTPLLKENARSKQLDNDYKEFENQYYRETGTVKGGYPIVKGLAQGYYWLKNVPYGDSQARDIDLAQKYYEDRSNIVGQETIGDYHYNIYSNGVRVPSMRRVEKGVWRPVRFSYR